MGEVTQPKVMVMRSTAYVCMHLAGRWLTASQRKVPNPGGLSTSQPCARCTQLGPATHGTHACPALQVGGDLSASQPIYDAWASKYRTPCCRRQR